MAPPIPRNENLAHWENVLPWLYGFLALTAFSRCLFLGQAYFDNDLLAQFGPWRAFLRTQLLSGHFPLWNPYLLGGCPFLADLQNMVFYPLNWLTLPFSVPTGMSLFFCLHFFLALWGMDFLLNGLGLSPVSRFAGALIYGFSNFFWLEIIHPPVLAAFALLPWMMGSIDRWTMTLTPKWSFLSGFSFALLFLCGSPQLAIGAFYGGLFFSLFGLWFRPNQDAPFSWPKLALTFLFVIWGALPLLAQWVPSLEFSQLSDRGSGIPWDQLKHSLSLNPGDFYQAFLPRIQLPDHTSLAEAVQLRDGPDHLATSYLGMWAFAGIWTPLLVIGGLIRVKRNNTLFWVLLALAGLILSLGQFTPLFHWIFLYLPGFSMIRVAYRYLYLFILPVSVLAAWGWETVFEKPSEPSIGRFGKYLYWIYGIFLFLAAWTRPSFNWREIIALVLGLLAMAGWKGYFGGKKGKQILAMSALAVPLFLNAWGVFQPGPASNFDFEKNSKSLALWGKSLAPRRIFFDNAHMYYPIQVNGTKYILNYPQNTAADLRIKDIGGYNPLVLKAKNELGTLPFPLVARLTAIGGVVTGFDQSSFLGLDLTRKTQDFDLRKEAPYQFLIPNRLPSYVFAPKNVLSVSDSQSSLALLRDPGFDPDQTVVLLSPPAFSFSLGTDTPVLSYEVLLDETDRQSFAVTVSRPCVAVFCENQYPGWKAWVDGKPTPILTADQLLRALPLEGGSHRVEFRFEPFWWPWVTVGLAAWLVLSLMAVLFYRKRLIPAVS